MVLRFLFYLLFAVLLTSAAYGEECHPSYEGACVPIASDVDCAGGSGNGPAFVAGPVYVVGPDVYGRIEMVTEWAASVRISAASKTLRLRSHFFGFVPNFASTGLVHTLDGNGMTLAWWDENFGPTDSV